MLWLIQASLNYLERCEGSAPPHLNWNVEYATITPIPLIKIRMRILHIVNQL